MTIRPRTAAGVCALLFASAVVSSCAAKNNEDEGKREAVPVVVSAAARQSVPLEARAIGHVDPFTTVSVRARVSGEIIRMGFKEGQNVRKGDLLFQIDPRPYQAELAQAQAQVDRDRAIAKNNEEDVKRYADLVAKDYVTREQYDATRSNAAATLASVRAGEAAVQNARLQLAYCTVTAPIAGRAGSVLVYPGNLVSANDVKPLVVLNQIQPVLVSFSVPESSLGQIRQHARPGQKLPVRAAPAGSGATSQAGELTFLDNTVDPTTGTILLKGTFPNENETLWPGEYVDVVLTLTTEPNAIVVPSQAVQTGQNGQYVYVVKRDLTVESRSVSVARTQGPLSIVAKGLQPGERVVTDGQLRLAPGAKVEIKSEEGKAS